MPIAAHDGAEQLALGVQIRAKRCGPAEIGSLDCAQICHCDDGSDYVVKDRSGNVLVPHSEWFCTHLGEAVGLASPPCKVVDVQGVSCFGSRWESGHDAAEWWYRAQRSEIDFNDLAPTLSRIYAFDLFVNNIDRHFLNFIVRRQHFGVSLLAFDYSQAWLVNGLPPPTLPMAHTEKTVAISRILRKMFGHFLREEDVGHVLDSLEFIKEEKIVSIIDGHPKDWLTEEQKASIVSWWSGVEKNSRIDDIRKGVKDGSYL
jgi:hypothetical protein